RAIVIIHPHLTVRQAIAKLNDAGSKILNRRIVAQSFGDRARQIFHPIEYFAQHFARAVDCEINIRIF
uniref:Uncharacterized protein n=1 Tax=Romanomermis culicivorax TaxID=13658 RepID=A0A915KMY7_ROMCU